MVIGQDGSDARLLQHDLGDPDAIGVAAGAPREVAAVFAEPGEKAALECFQRARSELRFHARGIVARMRRRGAPSSRSELQCSLRVGQRNGTRFARWRYVGPEGPTP